MAGKKRVRHTGEQIVDRLRDGEAMLACGKDLAHVLQTLGIAESTWQRWRKRGASSTAACVPTRPSGWRRWNARTRN